MPNFWTNTTQLLYEKFKGPRTKDLEFESKYEQIKAFEKHSNHLKSLFLNFQKNTLGMKNYFKDVTNLIPPLYENTSPYTPHILEVSKYHAEIENYFDVMCNEMVSIGATMNDWGKYYEDINNLYKQRENMRRIYDHYDEKMEKFIKIKEEKAFKNLHENQQELTKFDRNEEKYRNATKDYISISIFTYKKMNEFLDLTYILIMDEERKFFNFCSETLNKYDNLKNKFQQIGSNYKRPPENYNPLKYVRGSKLMDESFINSNFPELDFSQNLQEWKDKEKNGKKGVLTYEEYLKKAKDQRLSAEGKPSTNANALNQSPNQGVNAPKSPNLQKSSSNKFSYEDYKKLKGLNVNVPPQPSSYSPNVNFNQNRNNDLDFNKINDNFSFSNNNNKLDPLNFNVPQSSAPANEYNPYENIGLDNLKLNSNPYNQQAINQNNNYYDNMGGQSNFGFSGHGGFPMNNNNNFNQGFPQNNMVNPYNNKNQNTNKINNDFFNINNLDFPK